MVMGMGAGQVYNKIAGAFLVYVAFLEKKGWQKAKRCGRLFPILSPWKETGHKTQTKNR